MGDRVREGREDNIFHGVATGPRGKGRARLVFINPAVP